MSFNWIEYLDLAKELKKDTENNKNIIEAKTRTTISRAYYFAFNFVKNYLISTGEEFSKTAKVHREVIEKLRDIAEKEVNSDKRKKLIETATNLGKLRNFRNRADYDNIFIKTNKFACDAIKSAEKIELTIKSIN